MIAAEILGSLLTDPNNAQWTAYSANFVLGADVPLIDWVLDTMGDGETTGV